MTKSNVRPAIHPDGRLTSDYSVLDDETDKVQAEYDARGERVFVYRCGTAGPLLVDQRYP